SEEFVDFFRDTAERVTRSHGDEKLEALRNAFVNGTTIEGSQGPLKEIVLRIVGDLTASHMLALRAASDRQEGPADPGVGANYIDDEYLQKQIPGLSAPEAMAVAFDLLAAGLFGNWWQGKWGGANGRTDRYFITDLGRSV